MTLASKAHQVLIFFQFKFFIYCSIVFFPLLHDKDQSGAIQYDQVSKIWFLRSTCQTVQTKKIKDIFELVPKSKS